MTYPLVFIHGWGQSAQIWYAQRAQFPNAHYINLPGHGGEQAAEDWLAALQSQCPQPCILIGWSLGGMLAMQYARAFPQHIKGLALIASTPRFFQTHDWLAGNAPSMYDVFVHDLDTQAVKTMHRFFHMMLHGEGLSRAAFNTIAKHAINRAQPPSHATLIQGMNFLRDLDLRAELQHLHLPTLIIHGENDAVIPAAASQALAEGIADAKLIRMQHRGHAPFITQHETFNATLEAWCQSI